MQKQFNQHIDSCQDLRTYNVPNYRSDCVHWESIDRRDRVMRVVQWLKRLLEEIGQMIDEATDLEEER